MNESNPARDMWYAAIELLRTEGSISGAQEAFIRLAQPLTTADDIFVIAVGSEFVKNWLEEHITREIESKLSDIMARNMHLTITVDPALTEMHADSSSQDTVVQAPHAQPAPTVHIAEPEPRVSSSRSPSQPELTHSQWNSHPNLTELSLKAQLNPHNTFDNFVVGDSNRFAHATSFAVAESPGTTYNPLFLYSESGMGKTHLMHAIGNYALSLNPTTRVRYVTSEDFTSDFTDSVKSGRMAEFKNQFRTVDILLIDDIQFIGGKSGTVEEFFHTFNALTNANKQIVITSDVAPSLLKGFEERLLSRFNSGVTADIDRPNLETGVAILEKKAIADGIHVPRDVLEYIASNITTNIREMEGALRNVTAFAGLSNQTVDLRLAEMVLKDLIADPEHVVVTAGMIMAQTANYFQLSIDDLTSPDRSRGPATARQIAMFLCRQMTDLSLPKIGEIFGGRDHTTVLHAYKKINKQMSEKQTTYNQVQELTSRIKQAAKNTSAQGR
jgi:chromosomal replication initiator protein